MNDLPLPSIGHNQPPEPIDPAAAAAVRVAALEAAAKKWGDRKAIETEETASLCADYLSQLEAHWAEIEAQRKKEKKPFDDGAAAVQARYKPLLDRILLLKGAIKPLHDGWLRLKARRLEEERERARREAEEAQRRADQLAEQAGAGGPGTVANLIIATEAAEEADRKREEAAAIPKRAQSRGALGGRTRSLHTVWCAQVVEQDLCYRHFRDHADVKETLQRLANAAARGGMRNPALPGCYIFSEEQ